MGIGFTIDTPLKVSKYGINSVISMCDDILMEKLRKFYSEKYNLAFIPINESIEDFRAKRITAYLNLINDLTNKQTEDFIYQLTIDKNLLKKYSDIFPQNFPFKEKLKSTQVNIDWLKENMPLGSIDVNIMTKLDKVNYINDEKLPNEYNDAHAALRGFANSNLNSSVIFSAGMNPKLYSYIAEFEDFYPDVNGKFKKRIILKVSDYRSAFIQGKFLANKGLWVSEYRIESGLNCGGHVFTSDGHLLGPILAELRDKRDVLAKTMFELFTSALAKKNRNIPKFPPPIHVTAQGGVGTSEEHEFLLSHYNLNSVGWASPFLLVPEVTNIDDFSLNLLAKSKEEDLYTSNISPLGVPFNSLKGNSKDIEKQKRIEQGLIGSSCPKRYLVSNNEFTKKSICTASRQYQIQKLKQLQNEHLSKEEYKKEYEKVIDKSCICVGLGTPALLVNNLDTTVEGAGVSLCPGPNMAYFTKKLSLNEMVDHIYGRTNVIERNDRPNIFIKELLVYIDFVKNEFKELKASPEIKLKTQLHSFLKNIKKSITYYLNLFNELENTFVSTKSIIIDELNKAEILVSNIQLEIEQIETI